MTMSIKTVQRERAKSGAGPLPTVRELRRLAADSRVRIYRQGGDWMLSAWSEGYHAWVERPIHYSLSGEPERVALAAALGV